MESTNQSSANRTSSIVNCSFGDCSSRNDRMELTTCGHIFCEQCIWAYIIKHRKCPCGCPTSIGRLKWVYVDESCPFCLDDWTDPVVAVCGHLFCRGCLRTVLRKGGMCPICDQVQDETQCVPIKALE